MAHYRFVVAEISLDQYVLQAVNHETGTVHTYSVTWDNFGRLTHDIMAVYQGRLNTDYCRIHNSKGAWGAPI